MYLADVFTVTVQPRRRCPGLSVPCGLDAASGLPVGLQLLGRPFDEATLLRAARALEREARAAARAGARHAEGCAMTRRIATLLWAALLVVPIAFLGVAMTLERHTPSTEHGALLLWVAVVASAFNVALSRVLPPRLEAASRSGREAVTLTRFLVALGALRGGGARPARRLPASRTIRASSWCSPLDVVALVFLYPCDRRWNRLAAAATAARSRAGEAP